eukprot:gnl/TRDRNA2_/TRDRNA2_191457_c0_seq1.p1 gnl/TRDRNA2_/TRDRNA2_191457_c0~~gnl/TRDRNA2_/TRDRNA2_191457_c0_seq1.p1  ORF type:complete len:544 (-),score=87.55 gnl/TRDRNA2_/TRDRNA2_191457_c0_seq1:133-1704(-)
MTPAPSPLDDEQSKLDARLAKQKKKADKQERDRAAAESLRQSKKCADGDASDDEDEDEDIEDVDTTLSETEAEQAMMPDEKEWLVEDAMQDIKVATIGNVDSGKSTLVGVLTKGVLDDGRGQARSRVFNFSHEQANGRTSSVAREIMGFSTDGEQVVMDRPGAVTAASRNVAWQHVVNNSQKVLTFIDLCGHEKYLKTTIFGLVGLCPDHAMIVVNANAGFQRMTREHLGIALALKIPITIVVTKIDIAPKNVYEENMQFLQKLLKSSAVKKQPIVVKDNEDVFEATREGQDPVSVCPIFCVSNVTGEGLPFLRLFLQRVQSRLHSSGLFLSPSAPAEFHIDGIFMVPGIGIVISGLLRAGRVKPNQTLLLGPDKTGQFRPVHVKSLHRQRVPVEVVESGQACSFNIRSLDKKYQLKKNSFRRGMVLTGPELQPKAIWTFRAEIVILHHATTIREGYQPLIHCGIIRQSATITHMSSDLLRTNDKAIVTFRWAYHPEFIKAGETILFREGRTKGLGTIIEIVG